MVVFLLLAAATNLCSCTPSRSSLDAIVTQMQDPDEAVRQEAAEKAADQGFAAIGPLADLMANADGKIASQATAAIAQIVEEAIKQDRYSFQRRQVIDALCRILSDERPIAVRRQALLWLAELPDERSLPAAAPLLTDADLWDPARSAVQAIPGAAASKVMIDALGRAPAPAVPALIETIGRRQDIRAVPALVARFQSGNHAEAAAAVAALAEIAEPVPTVFSVDALRRLPASDLDGWGVACIRYAELRAQRGKAEEAVTLLDALLDRSPSKTTQCAAIQLLGRVGDGGQAAGLVPYLVDPSPEVATAARSALVTIKDPPPAQGFQRWFEKREDLKFPSTVNARLLRMYGFAEPLKKAALLRVIVARQMPEAKQLLIEATTLPEPEVRKTAFTLIEEAYDGQDPAISALLIQGAKTDPEVRPEAIRGCLRYAAFLRTMDQQQAMQLYRELQDLAPDEATRAEVAAGMAQIADSSAAASKPATEIQPTPATTKPAHVPVSTAPVSMRSYESP